MILWFYSMILFYLKGNSPFLHFLPVLPKEPESIYPRSPVVWPTQPPLWHSRALCETQWDHSIATAHRSRISSLCSPCLSIAREQFSTQQCSQGHTVEMVVLANNSEPSFSTEPGEMTEWLEFWKLNFSLPLFSSVCFDVCRNGLGCKLLTSIKGLKR